MWAPFPIEDIPLGGTRVGPGSWMEAFWNVGGRIFLEAVTGVRGSLGNLAMRGMNCVGSCLSKGRPICWSASSQTTLLDEMSDVTDSWPFRWHVQPRVSRSVRLISTDRPGLQSQGRQRRSARSRFVSCWCPRLMVVPLDAIETDSIGGLRYRALIGVMVFSSLGFRLRSRCELRITSKPESAGSFTSFHGKRQEVQRGLRTPPDALLVVGAGRLALTYQLRPAIARSARPASRRI